MYMNKDSKMCPVNRGVLCSEFSCLLLLQYFMQCCVVAGSREQLSLVEYKRATHAVTEIERSIQSRDILKQGKYREFGQLMTKSHYSLR